MQIKGEIRRVNLFRQFIEILYHRHIVGKFNRLSTTLGKRSSSLLDVIGSMKKAGLTHKHTQAGIHTIGSNNWLKKVPQSFAS